MKDRAETGRFIFVIEKANQWRNGSHSKREAKKLFLPNSGDSNRMLCVIVARE